MTIKRDQYGKPELTPHNISVAAGLTLFNFLGFCIKVAVATWIVHQVWF